MKWNEENFDLEVRQIVVSMFLVCKLSLCVFRYHLTSLRLSFFICKMDVHMTPLSQQEPTETSSLGVPPHTSLHTSIFIYFF